MQPPYFAAGGVVADKGCVGAYFLGKNFKRTVPLLLSNGVLNLVDEEDAKIQR